MDHTSSRKARLLAFLGELLRYGLTTATSLLFLDAGLYAGSWIGVDPFWSYPALLTIVYVAVYLSYARFVFKDRPNRKTVVRFLIVLAGSWIANTLLFRLWLSVLHFSYELALITNTFVLGWIRFLLQKHFVFRKAPVPLDV